MDVVNWWLTWPTWLQDVSVVLLVLIFLSHAPRWSRGAGPRPS
jgi:hypothetical protein